VAILGTAKAALPVPPAKTENDDNATPKLLAAFLAWLAFPTCAQEALQPGKEQPAEWRSIHPVWLGRDGVDPGETV
jgi:hypothetical protein